MASLFGKVLSSNRIFPETSHSLQFTSEFQVSTRKVGLWFYFAQSDSGIYEIYVFWASQWNIKFCLFNQNVLLLDKKRKATKLANGKALLTVVVFNVNLYACFWRCFGIANVCQYELPVCVTGTRWAPTDCWSPKCNARAVARVTKTPAAKKIILIFLI